MITANLLLDTLHSDAPALPKADNDRLFYTVLEDYADITVKREPLISRKMTIHFIFCKMTILFLFTAR